MGSISY